MYDLSLQKLSIKTADLLEIVNSSPCLGSLGTELNFRRTHNLILQVLLECYINAAIVRCIKLIKRLPNNFLTLVLYVRHLGMKSQETTCKRSEQSNGILDQHGRTKHHYSNTCYFPFWKCRISCLQNGGDSSSAKFKVVPPSELGIAQLSSSPGNFVQQ